MPSDHEITDRWEYKMISRTQHQGENLSALNREGANGWELAVVGMDSFTLKRRVCKLCKELQSP
jgi:hypothetical protein